MVVMGWWGWQAWRVSERARALPSAWKSSGGLSWMPEVAVIGAAIEGKVAGLGHRPIAERLGVPKDTVRGWLRRFVVRAGQVRAHFTRWAVALDPELGPVLPAGSGVADALEAIAIAAR